jgi:hypothetical protein
MGWTMKRELDTDFVLKAKERAAARAVALRNDPHSMKVAKRGHKMLADHLRKHAARKKAYA